MCTRLPVSLVLRAVNAFPQLQVLCKPVTSASSLLGILKLEMCRDGGNLSFISICTYLYYVFVICLPFISICAFNWFINNHFSLMLVHAYVFMLMYVRTLKQAGCSAFIQLSVYIPLFVLTVVFANVWYEMKSTLLTFISDFTTISMTHFIYGFYNHLYDTFHIWSLRPSLCHISYIDFTTISMTHFIYSSIKLTDCLSHKLISK